MLEIVEALEREGCSVLPLPFLPKPDKPTPTARFLLVGRMGLHYLFMIKEGKGKTLLTPTENDWLNGWKGIVYVIENAAQALGCLSKGTYDDTGTKVTL